MRPLFAEELVDAALEAGQDVFAGDGVLFVEDAGRPLTAMDDDATGVGPDDPYQRCAGVQPRLGLLVDLLHAVGVRDDFHGIRTEGV